MFEAVVLSLAVALKKIQIFATLKTKMPRVEVAHRGIAQEAEEAKQRLHV